MRTTDQHELARLKALRADLDRRIERMERGDRETGPSRMVRPTTYTNGARDVGGNPFSMGTRNATNAAQLIREDPKKAKRLYREAHKDGTIDRLMEKSFAAWV